MKFYIIAGEASGDLHASNLMKEMKAIDPSCDFRCWGGDLMQKQGGVLIKHYRDLAFMGFAEVAANFRTILNNIRFCKEDILKFQPEAVILVDYPGFNLRIAEFAKKAGLKVYYYISPQIWAWKKSRVHTIKKYVDRMFVILPFEQEFYARYDYEVDFVGHPLLDVIEAMPENEGVKFRAEHRLGPDPIIALLPGSRKQEIKAMLSVMLEVTDDFTGYQFVIAGAPSQEKQFYDRIIGESKVKLVEGQTYRLLQNAFAALVTSGTATLETALFEVPEVVCYKGNILSYQIAKRVIDLSFIKYISLVNLIMDDEVVKELIQQELTVKKLKTELQRIIKNVTYREQMIHSFKLLKSELGGSGASARTARAILNSINS